jgi:hypothetical protein
VIFTLGPRCILSVLLAVVFVLLPSPALVILEDVLCLSLNESGIMQNDIAALSSHDGYMTSDPTDLSWVLEQSSNDYQYSQSNLGFYLNWDLGSISSVYTDDGSIAIPLEELEINNVFKPQSHIHSSYFLIVFSSQVTTICGPWTTYSHKARHQRSHLPTVVRGQDYKTLLSLVSCPTASNPDRTDVIIAVKYLDDLVS